MERIFNSIEELYQLITNALPEGYIERMPNRYGAINTRITCYFIITDFLAQDRVRIEYGKVGGPTIIDRRLYKYV